MQVIKPMSLQDHRPANLVYRPNENSVINSYKDTQNMQNRMRNDNNYNSMATEEQTNHQMSNIMTNSILRENHVH